MSEPNSGRVVYQPPYVLSMILCDAIYMDYVTGKHSLLGCFDAIRTAVFPVTIPQLWIHASLTDGRHPTTLNVRAVNAADNELPGLSGSLPVDFSDPRAIKNVIFSYKSIVLDGPGELRFQLYAFDHFLIERRLFVIPIPGQSP